MTQPKVVHLVDDTTAGGVMRVLDHITSDPRMARHADHVVLPVRRGALSFRRIDADVIVSHLAVSWRALPGLIALRAVHPEKPLIHVEHSYTEAFTAMNVRHTGRFYTLLRTAFALFDQIVAVSKPQARWLEQRDLVRPDQIRVIASTVDLARFANLPAPTGKPRVIGAIGRLDRQKGFDMLIQAFRACPHPDLRLRVTGTGAEEAALRRLAVGDHRIEFTGHLPDPVAAMAAVDVVAMPSRWEAFGLVALEARAAGRPVLVNLVDGLADHLEWGATAVESTSAQSWTEAIEAVAQNDRTADEIRRLPAPDAEAIHAGFADGWQRLLSTSIIRNKPTFMLNAAS